MTFSLGGDAVCTISRLDIISVGVLFGFGFTLGRGLWISTEKLMRDLFALLNRREPK